MAAPRTKRQFAGAAADPSQRQITFFFGPSTPSTFNVTAAASASQPPLPANVQANLLSVGMRVRKSVPEGYKTGKEFSSFKLWVEGDSHSQSYGYGADDNVRMGEGMASPRRELLPFCGIHSVGGLASQPQVPDYRSYGAALPGLDDMPGLTSSQESNSSTGTAGTTMTEGGGTRKRFFDEEESADAPVRVWRDHEAWLADGEVSPRSLAPSGWGNARVMAVPRRKGIKAAAAVATTTTGVMGGGRREDGWGVGQENMLLDDFEEAGFLDYRVMDVDG